MRSSDRQIRLLDLLPGQEDHPVRCTTHVVSLNDHPDFETVSYVWGDRTGEITIDVSGNAVPVTDNLLAGLRCLRQSKSRRTLWIDQICINQWDLQEKAAQVALMRDIYKQCTRCITWMGELARDGINVAVGDAEAVFEFLRQVANARSTPLHGLPTLFQDSEKGLAAREAFGHFSMYGNAWWSRIWTVQEAIIPPSGLLIWGPLSISRETVLAAARNLRDLNSWPSLSKGFVFYRHEYTELLRRLLYPVQGFAHSRVDNALDLLMRWRHRQFTDPRDKVYALLGMIASDAIPSARYCDYTIAVSRLFAQVTQDLIKHEESLRPLLGACELPQSTAEIPSWAIDFACCNRIGKRQLKWWGHSHRYKAFSACGDNGLELTEACEINSLGLKGVYLDEVWDIAELLRINAQDTVELHELHQPLASIWQLSEQFQSREGVAETYKDGFTWHSALCRTLVGDLIMDEIPMARIATFGRRKLQADFEELLYESQIPLGGNLDLDFVAVSASDSARTSVSSVYVTTSPAYSPTSPVYPSTPPISLLRPHRDVTNPPAYSPEYPMTSEEYRSDDAERLPEREGPGTASDRDFFQRPRLEFEQALSETSKDWRPSQDVFADLHESLVGMLENQTFFITKSGYIGIGPPDTKSGDQVWIFNGGNVPFVMREIQEEKNGCPQLALVGDAYVHGVMDGEAMGNGPHIQTVQVN